MPSNHCRTNEAKSREARVSVGSPIEVGMSQNERLISHARSVGKTGAPKLGRRKTGAERLAAAKSKRCRIVSVSFQLLARNFGNPIQSLASQSIPTWNQIVSWLKEMETLRQKGVA